MTTNLVEQRVPIIIQLFSRIPAYAHFLASIMTIFIFWVRPSLAPTMPMPVRKPVPEARALYKHSNKSITSTLVDRTSDNVDELNETRDLHGELGPVRHGFRNPFSKLTGPVKHAMSPTISRGKSYARRVSVPTRRLTGHLAAAISTPFHHRRRSLDPAICSYFATHDIEPLDVVKEEKVEVEVEVVGVEQDVTVLDSHASKPAAPRKPTKLKRVVTKAKAILRIRRRRS